MEKVRGISNGANGEAGHTPTSAQQRCSWFVPTLTKGTHVPDLSRVAAESEAESPEGQNDSRPRNAALRRFMNFFGLLQQTEIDAYPLDKPFGEYAYVHPTFFNPDVVARRHALNMHGDSPLCRLELHPQIFDPERGEK